MDVFINLDLFSVGIAVAATGILGFAVFLNNRKSITNRAFLLFSLVTVFWSTVNYSYYQVSSINLSFWLIRLVIFFGTWHAFSIFQLFYVFPEEKVKFTKKYKFILLPVAAITSLITFTPLVFEKVEKVSSTGQISEIQNGPGIFLFGAVVLAFIISGIYLLIKKTIRAKDVEKKQFKFVLAGTVITFSLLMAFNFILPAFFNNPGFIPLGAVFIFPFIAFTFYAIVKHRLLNIKVIAAEILTFLLAVVMLFEVVVSREISVIILRSSIFALVLAFGILLIRSVRREVEQREKLELLTKELQAANEKLKELDKLKSEFLSFASHQIKSPMAVVKGFAELIYGGSYGAVTDKVKEAAVRIKEAVDRLLGLVNNFLDLRRIEEGRMEYSFEVVDAVGFIKKIADDMTLLAREKNLDLSFEPKIQEIKAKLDVQKFSQVIQNLIDNSIKYTDKGWVRVTVDTSSSKELLITIADSGRGISAELKSKLFEQFSRDAAVDKSKRGTGLGLFIAKQIVSAHQGQIWVESPGENKGSTFFVKLPIDS